ncbi:probable 2-oxoglutarate-dependent dioxygenase At5g05600 [Phoenix dactylifera]|uniref:Probable 2-oxoglutarate-dependent dioxygenase At5g05600 n=1 Tax=Phoenix dactylifera TaxID=42345 RepID=A0A8B7C769_PHODC|nr:probable 2-oxoglutarate-dependent dioxygenase At5g05600 [Phoenix dactylifera]
MECPLEWPEPVVPVQSLADAAVIPDRYVKPPSERPGDASKDASVDMIPIVDLGGLTGGAAEREATMREISGACKEWGFFQVVNHGVSPELMRRAREVWREFFHLPPEEKQVFANSPNTFEGYGSRLGIQKGASLDWGDYFFLHLRPESIKNQDKWPALPASLRKITEAYGTEVVKLCGVLMQVLSITLGLDESFLQKAFGEEEAGACMRVNYYPKCPQPDLTLGISSHSDPGGFTILLPDERVQGLQVRKGDAWVTVQSVPHAFIVNLGDQIQVLSNAIYKSVEHRVFVNAAEARISIALFYNPKGDLLVGPAPETVTPDRPPLYKPMTFDKYRLFIRKKGLCGKSQVESLIAM